MKKYSPDKGTGKVTGDDTALDKWEKSPGSPS